MDYKHYYQSSQCVELNSINDTIILEQNLNNDVVDIQPFMYPPLIAYEEELVTTGNISILYYQYCGPLIVLIKLFSKYTEYKYELIVSF